MLKRRPANKIPSLELLAQFLCLCLTLCFSNSSVAHAQRTEIVSTGVIFGSGSFAQNASGRDSKGNLAVSFAVSNSLRLWVDDGAGGGIAGDGVVNGSEVRVIASGAGAGTYNSLARDRNGNLAISYVQGTDGLALWVDDGRNGGVAGDGRVNGDEIRIIHPGHAGSPVGTGSFLLLDSNGNLAIGYLDGLTGTLRLWIDDGSDGGIAGDGVANGGEIRTVEGSRKGSLYISLALTVEGYLALSYGSGNDLATEERRLWIDDGYGGGVAGDGFINGEEVRILDAGVFTSASALTFDKNGHFAHLYYDSDKALYKLWVDDGAGDGIAGDREVNGSEIREVPLTGSATCLGLTPDSYGNLAFATRIGSELKLWVDDGAGGGTAGDYLVNGAELRTIDAGPDLGLYCSMGADSVGNLTIAYLETVDIISQKLKLARIAVYEPETIDSALITTSTYAAVDSSGYLAVGYFDWFESIPGNPYALKLWIDDGHGGGVPGDGVANGSEIRIVDHNEIGYWGSISLTPDGSLAMAYPDDYGSSVRLWVDDGRGGGIPKDGQVNGDEIRLFDGGHVEELILGLYEGNLALIYYDYAFEGLKLWVDDGFGGGTSSDKVANGGEIRTIDSSGGIYLPSQLGLDRSGNIAVSYAGGWILDPGLKLWIDDGHGGGIAGDLSVNGDEIRIIDNKNPGRLSVSLGSDRDGNLAISYSRDNELMLWIDDGRGGGTAGDGIANGSEIRTTGLTARVAPLLLGTGGNLVMSFTEGDDLKLWVDDGAGGGIAGDGVINGTEIRTADGNFGVGEGSSLIFDGNGHLAVSYRDVANKTVKTLTAIRRPKIELLGNAQTIENGKSTPGTSDNTDFGKHDVGSSSVTKPFTIQNTGKALLQLQPVAVSLSGPDAADFTVAEFPSLNVTPGGTSSFAITFNPPTIPGVRTAEVQVRSNNANEPLYTFTIQGAAVTPEISILGNGSEISSGATTPGVRDGTDFGAVGICEVGSKTFTIKNLGSKLLTLGGAPRVAISGSSAFTVTSQPDAIISADGGTSTFTVRFEPTSLGSSSATISIENDDLDENPYIFTVAGSGVPGVDTDGDGILDCFDPDKDNDGVPDEQEIIDGTDPLDADDFIEHAAGEYCLEWNGFLSNLLQVFEVRNADAGAAGSRVTLRDWNGVARDAFGFSLSSSEQRDVITNVLNGFTSGKYGQVCATVLSGKADALNTQMSVYDYTDSSFNFAYATRYAPGLTGPQYVGYNHIFPTLNVAQYTNFAGGFLQIVNEEDSTESGRLVYYDAEGLELKQIAIEIPGRGRRDIDTHSIGADTVGMLAWQPDRSDAKFRVALNRYYFDSTDTLTGAVVVLAKRGSGAELTTPFDTESKVAVLELGNTLASPVDVKLQVYRASGESVGTSTLSLPPKATRHVILNDYLESGLGKVTVAADKAGAIIVGAMEYGMKADGLFGFVTTGEPSSGAGRTLVGSYNNYLGGCALRLANKNASAVSASLSMTRYDGTSLPITSPVTVPGNGAVELDICAAESAKAYGEVSVLPAVPRSIVGDILRLNADGTAELRLRLIER